MEDKDETDTVRRGNRNREQIQKLLKRYRRSGKTQEHFAIENGLNLGTFRGWLYRKRKGVHGQGRFISVALEKTATDRSSLGPSITIEMPGGHRVMLPTSLPPAQLEALLLRLVGSC